MVGARITGWGALLLCAQLLCFASIAEAKSAPAPDAAKVVVRGRTLADALEIACQPAWAQPKKLRPVVLIFDVTPNMKAATERIGAALAELTKRERKAKGWRVARLGAKPGKARPEASELGGHIPDVVSRSIEGRSTVALLRQTLASIRKYSVVVYLADWRFEDDFELEALIKDLSKKKVTFSVVGSEAAFGRGWDDGIKRTEDLLASDKSRGGDREHFGDIGRNPFAGSDDAPWHGGEVALPGIPYLWSWNHWKTELSDYDWYNSDLVSREDKDAEMSHTNMPLPSGFGPYGLMRAAGVTDGRYVLAGWGTGGRRNVKYDYARCNLFAPDLRAREAIRKDLKRNRYLRATLAAWHILLEAGDDLIEIRPPFDARLKTPSSVDTFFQSGGVGFIWDNKAEYRQFAKAAPVAVKVLDRAIKRLDKGLKGDDVPEHLRRYHADAQVLAHICRVVRFELRECLSLELPKDLWAKGGRPGILRLAWVRPGRDPDNPRLRSSAQIWDEATANALLAERSDLLRRLRGTPWGEQIAINEINYATANWWDKTKPGEYLKGSRRKPKPPPPKRPGGGSSGGGPTTGGG